MLKYAILALCVIAAASVTCNWNQVYVSQLDACLPAYCNNQYFPQTGSQSGSVIGTSPLTVAGVINITPLQITSECYTNFTFTFASSQFDFSYAAQTDGSTNFNFNVNQPQMDQLCHTVTDDDFTTSWLCSWFLQFTMLGQVQKTYFGNFTVVWNKVEQNVVGVAFSPLTQNLDPWSASETILSWAFLSDENCNAVNYTVIPRNTRYWVCQVINSTSYTLNNPTAVVNWQAFGYNMSMFWDTASFFSVKQGTINGWNFVVVEANTTFANALPTSDPSVYNQLHAEFIITSQAQRGSTLRLAQATTKAVSETVNLLISNEIAPNPIQLAMSHFEKIVSWIRNLF